MINEEKLRKKIDASGYKMKFIAAKLGISYFGFLNKVHGKYEFTASEIKKLQELLNLTDAEVKEIFFV